MALELIYMLCIIADYAVMLCFALKKKHHHQKIGKLFRKLIIVLSITVFSSTFATVLPHKEWALFFESVHFMSTEWVLIYLLVFLEHYVGHTVATMRTRLSFMIYAAFSSLSLFLNCIFHHVIDCERFTFHYFPKDFYYIDLYKTFTELVTRYDISPKQLKLEITETAFIQDVEKQLELIGKLQALGFDMEIDDFGSGYSSLNMLKDWTADVLKIDMGFLREIESRKRTKVILGTIVDLAKRLNMTVITEGVETREQVDYLTSVGCDMFQGYYFAKPIPVEQFEKEYL